MRTNREAHEEAAGMGLCDEFFTTSGIDPDAPYEEAEEPQETQRELPKLADETLELMRACGSDELDRAYIALDGREQQLTTYLIKISSMEALLREMRESHKSIQQCFESFGLPQQDWRCDLCKRVDALLEGK